jgi:imidazolonepropionase-like amidohydrolase
MRIVDRVSFPRKDGLRTRESISPRRIGLLPHLCRGSGGRRVVPAIGSQNRWESSGPPKARKCARGLITGTVLALAIVNTDLAAQTLTITNATIIDVSNGATRRSMTVVIQGNRIVTVDQATGPSPLAGQVIDAKGSYLIPGLWDMHTHVYFGSGTVAEESDFILPLFIANGITGIRDMGSELDAVLDARTEIAAHRLLGPRMIVAGPMLDGPNAGYAAAIRIATPAAGRNAVDSLKMRGVDFIKVQSGVPREAYFAIADEANKMGIEFEGHVPDAIRASEAVRAGQRSFEHLIGIFEASTRDEDAFLLRKEIGKDSSDQKRPGLFLDSYVPAREASIIQLLAQHGVWQCPTLFWERGQWLVDAVDYTKASDLVYAPRSWIEQWPGIRKWLLGTLDSDPLPVRERFVDHELDIVGKLHTAGVPFLAGTDAPTGVDLLPGISLHLELQRFVAAGFTPLEALQTATVNPAKFFGKLSDFGAVAPGHIADLVLLRANPLDDIANTQTVVGVIADGRYFSGVELDELRAKLRALAAKP